MSGSLTFSKGHAPVGYVTPSFPSLDFNLDDTFHGNPYQAPLLFYGWDVYRFTVYWFLIFSFGIHLMVASIACVMDRKTSHVLWILATYTATGAFFGFSVGSLVGVVLGAIYRAGALHVSTWTPFSWALLTMLYLIVEAYPMNSRQL